MTEDPDEAEEISPERAALLLASARGIQLSSKNTFPLQDWRTTMGKNVAATTKAKEVKAAAKKVAAKTPPYKHEPKPGTPDDQRHSGYDVLHVNPEDVISAAEFDEFKKRTMPDQPFDPEAEMRSGEDRRAEAREDTPERRSAWPTFREPGAPLGVDSGASGVVSSGVNSTTTEGATMNDVVTKTKQEIDAEAAQAKIAAKAAKAAEAQKLRDEKIAKAEQEKATKKAQRDAQAAERAKAKEGQPEAKPMTALGERTKAGIYAKGLNGQLRSSDEIAIALEAVPATKTVELLLKVLGLGENPYAHLNYGQQSMNLRNKLRGAVRSGVKVGDQVITVDYLKLVRDSNGYATAEAEMAEKRESAAKAKADREAKAKAAADAKKAAEAAQPSDTPAATA